MITLIDIGLMLLPAVLNAAPATLPVAAAIGTLVIAVSLIARRHSAPRFGA